MVTPHAMTTLWGAPGRNDEHNDLCERPLPCEAGLLRVRHAPLCDPSTRGVCVVFGRTSWQAAKDLQRITDVSPRMQAFLETRRLLALAVAFYVVGAAVLLGLARRVDLIGPSGIVVLASVLLLALAVFVLRGEVQLWIAFLSLIVMTVAIFIPGESNEAWLPVPNLTVSVAYLGVLITSRWWSWFWILAGLTLSAVALVIRPVQVIFWAPEMPLGWIVVLQLMTACVLLWWTWQRLKGEARIQDEVHRIRHRQTRAAIARQERSRAWRSSAVALHESILNTIRYLLQTQNPDRRVLAEQSVNPAPFVLADPTLDTHSVAEVIARSRRVVASPVSVTVTGPASDAVLAPATAGALRVAMVEVVRNAIRHGQAGTVTVSARKSKDSHVYLTITDDGIGVTDSWTTGVGLRQALNDTVKEVGGAVKLASVNGGLRVEIALPTSSHHDAHRVLPVPLNQPRLVVAVILIAYGLVGISYLPFLIAEKGVWAVPPAIAFAFVAFALAVLFFQPTHVRLQLRRGSAIIAASVPWLLSLGMVACGQDSVQPAVLNASGFALLALALWLRKIWIVCLISAWAIGGLFLISGAPSECRQGLAYAEFNTLLVVPLVLGVAYLGVRQTLIARQAIEELDRSRIVESTQGQAWEDFNAELAETVQRASYLIDRVAQGQELDDPLLRQLMRCDARIRAGVQIDPLVTGSAGRLARDLITSACDAGVKVNVRSVVSSEDAVDIPLAVRMALTGVARTATSMSIQVMEDGSADQMSLTFSGVAATTVRDALPQGADDIEWEVLATTHSEQDRVHLLVRVPHAPPVRRCP